MDELLALIRASGPGKRSSASGAPARPPAAAQSPAKRVAATAPASAAAPAAAASACHGDGVLALPGGGTVLRTIAVVQQQLNAQFVPERGLVGAALEAAEETTLVDDEQALRAMVRYVWSAPALAVDCEGSNLGRFGTLSLVQVADTERSFVVDLVALPDAFDRLGGALRRVLEDPERVLVMHDCRRDSDALMRHARVRLARVFDTQVAHAIVARRMSNRGGVPLPAGLNTVLARYGDDESARNVLKADMHAQMHSDPEFWVRRPLDRDRLLYAVMDVKPLVRVHLRMDYLLDEPGRAAVAKHSAQYAAMLRDVSDAAYSGVACVRQRERVGLLLPRADGSVPTRTHTYPVYGIEEFDLDVSLKLQHIELRNSRPRR